MDIVEMTKDLAYAIQKDERFLAMMAAKEINDSDEELQKMIGDFNVVRLNLNSETQKEDGDKEKIEELDREVNELYGQIMQNSAMQGYASAKRDFDEVFTKISTIINYAASGVDPEVAMNEGGCSPDGCAGCSGCN